MHELNEVKSNEGVYAVEKKITPDKQWKMSANFNNANVLHKTQIYIHISMYLHCMYCMLIYDSKQTILK